jgi:hypothetical protein
LTDTMINRRRFFDKMGTGIYGAALTSLLGRDLTASTPAETFDLRPRKPHFEPRAKAVIHLFMNGGPSQMDLFDPKPELTKNHGKSYFGKIAGEVENPGNAGALLKSPFSFRQYGQCGMWVSEVMPQLANCVDDITLIRSMHGESITHEPSLFQIHSGRLQPGHPTLGAWVTYALGSENQNLPAYVVLDDPKGLPINRTQNWQNGYLPPIYQGTRFRAKGSPVLNLQPETGAPEVVQALERQHLAKLDKAHKELRPWQPQLDARISTYELAARMQLEASDALDFSQESPETLELYGIGTEPTDSYGRRCLIARRLVERGVRFVQLFIDGQIWDSHNNLATSVKSACDRTDKPVAALLTDMRSRGLLDDVLVMWGGEMGRLPIAQLANKEDEKTSGRDHNKNAMVTWMAGGGVKRGHVHGTTDEIGLAAAEQKVSTRDWHATMLHLLGLDQKRVHVMRNGLEERLTGVEGGRIVTEILA